MTTTFEPTVRHFTILKSLSDIEKQNIKHIISTLGYYQSIQFLIDNGFKPRIANYLSDIGCYMLEEANLAV